MLKHNGDFPSNSLYMSIPWLQASMQTWKWFEAPISYRTFIQSDVGKKESSCITYILYNWLHLYLCWENWKVKPGSFPCNHMQTSNLRTSTTNETQSTCSRSSIIECLHVDWNASTHVLKSPIRDSGRPTDWVERSSPPNAIHWVA